MIYQNIPLFFSMLFASMNESTLHVHKSKYLINQNNVTEQNNEAFFII